VVIGAKCKIAGFAVLSGFGSCCLKQYKLSNSWFSGKFGFAVVYCFHNTYKAIHSTLAWSCVLIGNCWQIWLPHEVLQLQRKRCRFAAKFKFPNSIRTTPEIQGKTTTWYLGHT